MKLQSRRAVLAAAVACALIGVTPPVVFAAVDTPSNVTVQGSTSTESSTSSLESAAAKASQMGRTVAMSLIALAFAVAGAVLAFRRDFKEAAGVFVVGLVAVLLASPAGVGLLTNTVTTLFGTG
jgi:L-lactate permease